jgi:hypothetical protein
MAPGRKRKPGKRYACGKRTRQETERDAMSTAIDARRRHFGVTAKQAKDERLGTALGRLAFRELISETQYQAGVAFAELYRSTMPCVGLPSPSPRSVAGLLINEGIFGASPSEPVLEVIEKLKRRFGEAPMRSTPATASTACRRRRPDAAGLPRHLHRRGRHALAGGGHRQPAGGAECAGEA